MRQYDLVNTLEALVDETDAERVIDALAAVCAVKATHLRESYTPQALRVLDARQWSQLADRLNAVPSLGGAT